MGLYACKYIAAFTFQGVSWGSKASKKNFLIQYLSCDTQVWLNYLNSEKNGV